MTIKRRFLLAMLALWSFGPSAVTAQTRSTLSADALDSAFHHDAGEVTTRFNLDVNLLTGVGGNDGTDVASSLILGLSAGIGYFPTEVVSADLDLGATLNIDEVDAGIHPFSITPGTHIYPIPDIFIRVGLPIFVTEPQSVNALAGVGYEFPISDRQTLVGEVDFVYPLTGDGSGYVTVGGGTTFSL